MAVLITAIFLSKKSLKIGNKHLMLTNVCDKSAYAHKVNDFMVTID